MLSYFILLPRAYKRLISVVTDLIGISLIGVFSLWLRFGQIYTPSVDTLFVVVLFPLVSLPVFIHLGLYRAVIRYISYRFAFVTFSAVFISFLLWSTIILLFDLSFPRSALIIAGLVTMLYVAGSRVCVRWLLIKLDSSVSDCKSVVIYGAGESGRQLMQAMESVKELRLVAFVDDDKHLKNHKIGEVKVFLPSELPMLIERFAVKEVLLAIPSLNPVRRRDILNQLEPLPVHIAVLPPIDHFVDGKISFSDVREVDVEDLLGRDVVPPKTDLLARCIQGQVVLVSGAGGSIGSELCRQIVNQDPKLLILFELCEFALYKIEQELLPRGVELVAVLGSVQDEQKIARIMNLYQVETVYHAAAYKHVPIVEHNIAEGVRNNSFGTHTIARVAAESGVKNFVLVSTDKAVRPTNFMGASKRLAEMCLQALQDDYHETRFVMVRFGNVLGSSGSVIPLFRQQIAAGGPVTVTHPEITRYFMTIPEAALLVIQAGSMGVGGDVFVLDMGDPVKIVDLARKVIHLSGLEVMDSQGNGDIEITFSGLRPGEKLYEELLIGDNVDGTSHPRIMKAHEDYLPYVVLKQALVEIDEALIKYDFDEVKVKITKLVSGFKHGSGIVDHLRSR